jgi:DNA-binding beta-propeller fold protein YncE
LLSLLALGAARAERTMEPFHGKAAPGSKPAPATLETKGAVGLAPVPVRHGTDPRSGWLAVDPLGHGCWFLAKGQAPEPVTGQAGADGKGGLWDILRPRFRQPRFVAVQALEDSILGPWRAAVADSGHNAVRLLAPVSGDEIVGNLAGGQVIYGTAGYKDGPGNEALFRDPRGLAWHGNNLFVADHGNGLVRRIRLTDSAWKCEVTTYAGKYPRPTQWEDPDGDTATLYWPNGLTVDPATGHLFVTDLNCVRMITGEGKSGILLGEPHRPGFENWRGRKLEPDASKLSVLVGVRCLNGPTGLAFHKGRLLIADTGNHAIRIFTLATGELTTLAGHPGQPALRHGRARNGDDKLDPKDCAALEEPTDLAFDPDGDLVVSTRGGLVRFPALRQVLDAQAEAEGKGQLVSAVPGGSNERALSADGKDAQ